MEALLDRALEQLRAGEIGHGMSALITGLDRQRASLPADEWRRWIDAAARPHALAPAVQEDPFIHHSATRPRGYPGDAELLDFIYRSRNVQPRVDAATPFGKRLYRYSTETPAPEAVRLRSSLTAAEVDRIAGHVRHPHVLSVACGHLREAPLVAALPAGRIGRYVGVDQDTRSLDLVRQEYGGLGVEALEYSVRDLLRRGDSLGRFDFVYVLGLYDYLSDETGARLLSRLFRLLNPGGKIWVANFTGALWSAGFMEALMDWWLIYRSPEEMLALGDAAPAGDVARREVFLDPTGNVAFLELVRR